MSGLSLLLPAGEEDTVPDTATTPRHMWASHVCAPCLDCSLTGWGAGCLATAVPCASPCLFATTRRRLLGGPPHLVVAHAVMYMALLWFPPLLALALAWRRDVACLPIDLDARGVTDAQRAACAAAERASAVGWVGAGVAFVVFAGVAAAGRRAVRARHGVVGTPAGDLTAWLFCPCLALAQEARTAEEAGCEAGVWGERRRAAGGGVARSPTRLSPGAVFAFER